METRAVFVFTVGAGIAKFHLVSYENEVPFRSTTGKRRYKGIVYLWMQTPRPADPRMWDQCKIRGFGQATGLVRDECSYVSTIGQNLNFSSNFSAQSSGYHF